MPGSGVVVVVVVGGSVVEGSVVGGCPWWGLRPPRQRRHRHRRDSTRPIRLAVALGLKTLNFLTDGTKKVSTHLVKRHESVQHNVQEDLCRHHEHLVLYEFVHPSLASPQVHSHLSNVPLHCQVRVHFYHFCLLLHQRNCNAKFSFSWLSNTKLNCRTVWTAKSRIFPWSDNQLVLRKLYLNS